MPNTFGTNFTINEETTGTQELAQSIILPDGRILVTWMSFDGDVDGSGAGISARIGTVQANGSVVWASAGEITVNEEVQFDQLEPQVIVLADGRLLFTWTSLDPDVDGAGRGIAARIGTIQTDGSIVWGAAGEFTVDANVSSLQLEPQVTQLADGRVLFTWQSQDGAVDGSGAAISARIGTVQSDGSISWASAGEFRVNEEVTNGQFGPQVMQLGDGRVLFTWYSADNDVDGSGNGVSVRVGTVQSNGSITWGAAGEVTVNEEVAGAQGQAQVTLLDDGRVLFTWTSADADVDGAGNGISARVGTVQTDGSVSWASAGEFTVNANASGDQVAPQLTVLSDGRVLFVWTSGDTGVNADVVGRIGEIQADGSVVWDPLGEFAVATETTNVQQQVQVTELGDGRVLITWNSSDSDVDGNGFGIAGVVLYNLAPVAADDSFAVYEDSTISSGNLFADNGGGADNPVDGDTLTISAVNGSALNVGNQITLASGALLTVNADGTFSYDPNDAFTLGLDENDTDSFTYTIDDGFGGTDTAAVTITVNSIDQTLTGTSGPNTLNGGDGDDVLLGLGGADTLHGDNGNDVIEGGDGDDNLDGGSGTDTLTYANAGAGITITYAAFGSPQNTGGAGTDTINDFENLIGSAFNDVLSGNGNPNTIDGGGGIDTISYAGVGNFVTVSLALQGTAQDTFAGGSDTLLNFENLIGTNFNDTLQGDANNNVIDGGSGADMLSYSAAGAGVTVSLSQAGAQDTIGAGIDTLSGFENLTGSALNDTLQGTSGNNTLNGGGGSGDVVSYSSAASGVTVSLTLQGGSQNTVGAGTDTLSNFEGITGSAFGDTLTGDGNANTIDGGDGGDTIFGGLGNDTLSGGNGTDTLTFAGAAAAASVDLGVATAQNTGSGTDTISGFENLIGTALGDTLTGTSGANTISGGAGNDVIEGGDGNDDLDGGADTDTLSYASAAAGITISFALFGSQQNTGGAGADTINDFENLIGSNFNDVLSGNGNANIIDGGAGTDTISYAGVGNFVTVNLSLQGSAQSTFAGGSDTLTGFENLIGTNFNDTLQGDGGNNVIDGGGGTDLLSYSSASSAVTVSLALQGGSQNTIGAGVDTLSGFENLTGTAGNDTLTGDGNANVLSSGGGVDTLSGLGGDDVLEIAGALNYAASGSVDGGNGTDTLRLSSNGIDQFLWLWTFSSIERLSITTSAFYYLSPEAALPANLAVDATGSGAFANLSFYRPSAGAVSVDISGWTFTGWSGTLSLFGDISSGGNNASADSLTGSAQAEHIYGYGGDDTLHGSGGSDDLQGGDGTDMLDGGSGADTMSGGAGNDTYVVDNIGDTITEAGPDGTDLVQSSVNFTLSANVENLTLTGSALNGTGNGGSNVITGNGLANLLTGSTADTLLGMDGDDVLELTGGINSGSGSVNGGNGTDTLRLSSNGQDQFLWTWTFTAIERLSITTSAFYYLAPEAALPANLAVDATGSGAFATLSFYRPSAGAVSVDISGWTFTGWSGTLNLFGDISSGGNNASADSLTGSSQADHIYGYGGDDTLGGNGGADDIQGGDGADTLNGGANNDAIFGGAGVDTAVFNDTSSLASWHRNANGSWTVTSADGVDTLNNIESLSFNDRTVHLALASTNFYADGTSDVLFRRSDGIVATWSVTGTTVNATNFLPAAGAEWTPLAVADVSSDSLDDVIWLRNDGIVYAWLMNGGALAGAVAITGIGAEWSFVGAGDFNGDLTDDLAWRNNDGVVYVWTMGNSSIQSAGAPAAAPLDFNLEGVGDFNGDGRDDFLWRNSTTGQTVIWEMNGESIAAAGQTSLQIGLDWAILGVGDTDGDGRDDIILQRVSNGTVRVWTMDGETVTASANVGAASPAQWTARDVGDYNGDGQTDILWQRADGVIYAWFLDGSTVIGSGAIAGVGAEWDVIGGG